MTPEELKVALDESNAKLTAANAEAAERRKTAKELNDKLALFGDTDPAEIKAMKEKTALAEQDRLKAEGNFEQALEEATKTLKAENEQLRESLTGKDTQLAKITIDNTFLGSIDGKAVNSEQVLALVRGNIKMEDGVPVVYDGDKPKLNGKNERMTVAEYGLEFLTANPHLAKADGGGSGSQGGDGGDNKGDKVMKRADYEKLGPAAKADHCKSGGTITD